jgi:hypothetical protein
VSSTPASTRDVSVVSLAILQVERKEVNQKDNPNQITSSHYTLQ